MFKRGKYEAAASAAKAQKQTRKTNLLSAYVTSLLCLMLCATMFLSTSMAWFTSEVENSGNQIYVGTLGVKLYSGTTEIKAGSEPIWDDSIYWQPDTMVIERFKIENTGNLAFTYRLSMSAADWAKVKPKEQAAAEAITVWVCEVDSNFTEPTTFMDLTNQKIEDKPVWQQVGTLADVLSGQSVFANTMAASATVGETVACEYAVALHMNIDASDECMGAELDNISIKLVASQLGSDIMYIPEGQTYTLSGTTHPITVYGEGTLVLNGVTINGTEMHPNALTVAGDITVNVIGETALTGAKNGSGIYVNAGATLKLTGAAVQTVAEGDTTASTASLTVIGNTGIEYESSGNYCKNDGDATAYEGTGGSGIYAANATVVIDGLNSLTAKGYGVSGFGIGGNGANVTIKNTTVDYVRGGFVNVTGEYNDANHNKTEPEGAPAIGGAKIVIENSRIKEAIGGSKGAGIGARFWQPANITITGSTIDKVVGGASSAGIGGSRVSGDDTEQDVTITIVDSKITAVGGYFGAGIGSGYDTHCLSEQPLCTINIDGSTINATGGQYAAGVGTGYHNAALAGVIKSSTVNADPGAESDKDTYTKPQDIGFGVVDPTREGQQTDSKLIYNGAEIGIPPVG